MEGNLYEATDVTGISGLQVASRTGKDLSIKFDTVGTEEVKETTATIDENGDITITLAQIAGEEETTDITATNADVKAALESVAGDAGIVVTTTDAFEGGDTVVLDSENPVNVPAIQKL